MPMTRPEKPAPSCRALICPKAAGAWKAIAASRRPTAPGTLKNCATNGAIATGPWPLPVERLLLATEIKIAASALRIRLVETQEDKLMFQQGQDYIMVSGKFPRLTTHDAISKLREIISWLVSLRSSP